MQKIAFVRDWVYVKENGERRALTLPHDAMIEEKRVPDSISGTGNAFFPGGVYTYEKEFSVPESWAGQTAILEFEAVYRNAKVFVNGAEAGGKPYGYIPFFVDMTPHLKMGAVNTLRVVADNSQIPNTRWYSGGGIYRPVWLHLGAQSHIVPQGVQITTLSYAPAKIKVATKHLGGEIRVEIIDAAGAVAAGGTGDEIELDIPNARLWSAENPYLYSCRVSLYADGQKLDESTEAFGVRKLEWCTKGLFVNGIETLLRGGCVHHDNGILGARSYPEAEARRVRIMKKAGFNAVRSAHNPLSKSMLEACDRLGMYVMDETWDMWYKSKNAEDYGKDFLDNWKYDVEALVSRDYNHPSVLMYSIGNEVSEPHNDAGLEMEQKLIAYVKQFDATRPVTCGINLSILFGATKGIMLAEGESGGYQIPVVTDSTSFNEMVSGFKNRMGWMDVPGLDEVTSPSLDMLDIAGYNYASYRYPLEGEKHPGRIVVGSETYPIDIGKNWDMVKQCPYLVGDFMWTAWDYIGEVGIGAWAYDADGVSFHKPYPWLLADTGAIDILGTAGAEAGYAAVVWGERKTPYIGVQPVNHPGVIPAKSMWRGTNAMASWAWHGCEGNEAVIEVYANAAEAELLLNGTSLGKKAIECYKAEFVTQYQPGELTAVAYDAAGKEMSRSSLKTPAGEAAIRVAPETTHAKPHEIVYVEVNIAYADGTVESNMDAVLRATVTGGELLAFGSANPRTEERFDSGRYKSYYGRAQAVVRCGESGELLLDVQSEAFSAANAKIRIEGAVAGSE